jgi:hypothetical protein
MGGPGTLPESDLTEIERALAAARERLAALHSERPGIDGMATDGPCAWWSDAPDDEVRVRASAANGRVTAVEFVDVRVMRLSSDELARLLVTTLNGALDASDAQVNAGAEVDLELVTQQFREIREEALGSLHQTMSSLRAAVERLRREAHVTEPAEVPDFHELFAMADESLAVGGAEPEDPVRGEGRSDAQGHVRAIAAGGRVESLVIDPTAMRKGSHELAALVVSAANAALWDLRERQRETRDRVVAERSERIRATQDRSVSEMRAFCDTMTQLMGSIRPYS